MCSRPPAHRFLSIFVKKIPVRKLSLLVAITMVLYSCNTLDVYEQMVPFPKHEWASSVKPSFTFNITDTLSPYHIYVVFRHEDAYRYNNIWMNVATQTPRDTSRTQLVNMPLANNAKGWLGTGMGDVIDHRVRITRAPILLKKGAYTFTLQHAMREEPLQYVLNAGIRVEKARS